MKKFQVIGNPIKHSLSPELHNYWIKNNNIDAIYGKQKLDEKLAVIIKGIEEKKLEYVNGYHLFFSIWAMTQHYADFDIQVKSILNQSEEELFDDAEEYLTSVLLRTLSVRAP